MKKTHQIIQVSDTLSVVVDKSAEKRVSEYNSILTGVAIDQHGQPFMLAENDKIIASIGERIEGLPLVRFEYKANEAANKYIGESFGANVHMISKISLRAKAEDFIAGYEAAQAKGCYTADVLRGFATHIAHYCKHNFNSETYVQLETEKFIKSHSQPKELTEIEFEYERFGYMPEGEDEEYKLVITHPDSSGGVIVIKQN